YKVFARGEQFLRHEGRVFRRNEIWRRVVDRRTGAEVGEELVKRNCALVTYAPTDVAVVDVTSAATTGRAVRAAEPAR
ncbi:MAG TPA: hypothetical protein VFS29_10425, partial [Motilibacteraceae bacterium]|nr:hypothetical protein [Motilibacteraceae bacterium]